MSSEIERAARDAILALLAARGPDKTICPSEAARAIGGADWREAMPTATLPPARSPRRAWSNCGRAASGAKRVGWSGLIGSRA